MRKRKIQLQGCQNTRDLGGIKTKDGRRIKAHKLIRSGALYKATKEDMDTLIQEYELKTIIDFRTLPEIANKPDPQREELTYYKNPVLEKFTDDKEEKQMRMANDNPIQEAIDRAAELPDEMKTFMISIYPQLVQEAHCVNAYRQFFQYLLEQKEGAVLWHCSEGKDRVGVGTFLLLYALGVDMETIKQDYLFTNDCIYNDVSLILGTISRLMSNRVLEEKIKYMLMVEPEYIESIIETVDHEYGSFDDFLLHAMGLGKEELTKLRDLYLEEEA